MAKTSSSKRTLNKIWPLDNPAVMFRVMLERKMSRWPYQEDWAKNLTRGVKECNQSKMAKISWLQRPTMITMIIITIFRTLNIIIWSPQVLSVRKLPSSGNSTHASGYELDAHYDIMCMHVGSLHIIRGCDMSCVLINSNNTKVLDNTLRHWQNCPCPLLKPSSNPTWNTCTAKNNQHTFIPT